VCLKRECLLTTEGAEFFRRERGAVVCVFEEGVFVNHRGHGVFSQRVWSINMVCFEEGVFGNRSGRGDGFGVF